VANDDRTVHPYLERFVANRMGATIYDLDSSHVAMLSRPDIVLDVISRSSERDPRVGGRCGVEDSGLAYQTLET
jgi:hypothetical protein